MEICFLRTSWLRPLDISPSVSSFKKLMLPQLTCSSTSIQRSFLHALSLYPKKPCTSHFNQTTSIAQSTFDSDCALTKKNPNLSPKKPFVSLGSFSDSFLQTSSPSHQRLLCMEITSTKKLNQNKTISEY